MCEERDQLARALRNLPVGVLLYDASRRLTLFNDPFLDLYGLPEGAIVAGMTLRDVIDACRLAGCYADRDVEEVHTEFRDAFERGTAKLTDRVSGDRLVGVSAKMTDGGGWILTFEDVTARQRSWDHLAFLAHHDPLTGLANRDLLTKCFETEIDRSRRAAGQFALLCLDLDRFKAVNDSLGHSAGDVLLQQVAARLRELAQPRDTIARTGGDEFIILQSAVVQPTAAAELADRLIAALSEAFTLNGVLVRIGTSIGIAIYPGDGTTADELLRNADVALYGAKGAGRGRYCLYDPIVGERQRLRRSLEEDLQRAVGSAQIELHYQPIIDCGSGQVRGFEALMRWTHPRLGPIPPETFIPIAEEAGLIHALGRWALDTACNDAAAWPGRLSVAVNVSPAQLLIGDLPDAVARTLRRTGLLATRLELEVTEGLLIANTDQALDALKTLGSLGVGLALDDFGTGYASLGYLQRFPFSRLKIARSFVQALGQNMGADGIVAAILAMSRSLFLDVTAEGVETAEQLALLRQHGCAAAQGNWLCIPMPAREIATYLQRPSAFGRLENPAGTAPTLLN